MSDKMPLKDYTYNEDGSIKDGSGLPVFGSFNKSYGTAFYKRNGVVEEVGNMVPDFLGSLSTSIRYKRLTLRASFDGRFGGYVASWMTHYGTAYGYLATSLENADAAHGGITYTSRFDGLTYDDGIIPEGIFRTGTKIPQAQGDPYIVTSGPTSPNGETYQELYDKKVIDPSHASSWTYFNNSWGNGVINDKWFRKLNYICFRDLTLSYSLPDKAARWIGAQAVNLQGNIHNLGYIMNSLANNENPEAVRGTRTAEFRLKSAEGVTSYYTFTVNVRF